jgi:scyllo-inositol 2-dehydrogenase (NADP+)
MINIAVIGTSNITEQFLQILKDIPEVTFYAVYSRDKGLAFGKKYGAEICYNSLADFAKDKLIDAVYIASPNSSHQEQAVYLMNAGKHVLVEKSIASNSREFIKMQETAKKNKVILMEEMRPIHDPGFAYMQMPSLMENP